MKILIIYFVFNFNVLVFFTEAWFLWFGFAKEKESGRESQLLLIMGFIF